MEALAVSPVGRARCLRIALLACGLLAALGCGRETRPNVLLISIDTLRADHLAAYGYERETSPALTQLALAGARFANSYAQSSSTVPTHASLFTGRYPFEHGSYHVGLPLRDEESTLAERLRDAGYRTFALTSSVRFRGRTGFDQGFDAFHRFDAALKNKRSALVTERLLEEIDASGDQPWFAFAHYFDPHQPYAPPAPWRTRWHPGLARPRPEGTSDYLYFHDSEESEVPADVLDYLRALYDAEITYLDAELQRLFDGIGIFGGGAKARRTLVVVISDHGEEFKEHGGFSHARRLHEELVRVPLLVAWPGHVQAGLVIDTPVQTVDVYATVLELAGLQVAETSPGRSRAMQLLVPAAFPREAGADIVVGQLDAERWSVTATLATGRFKLVRESEAAEHLYRLDVDPGGLQDVRAEHPEVVAKLQSMAAEIGLGGGGTRAADPVSDEIRARLREIGYVEEGEAAGAK